MNFWVKFKNSDQQKRISESSATIEHALSIGTFQIPFPTNMLVIFPLVHISDSSEHSTRGKLKSFFKIDKKTFSRRYVTSKSHIWKDFKCPVGYMVEEGNWNPFRGLLKSFTFLQLCAIYLRDRNWNIETKFMRRNSSSFIVRLNYATDFK